VTGIPLRRPPDGLFFVQDEASQLVALAVDAQPGERLLDLCAAPGGKATALAAAMGDRGVIVASDIRPRRMRLLHQTVALSGSRHTHVVQVPVRGPLPFTSAFNCVLVDAPCSGLGTVRRDPDIRWRRSEDDLAGLARDQVELLERAADVVAAGGRLVYATCSSEPEENEDVVDRFLGQRPEFQLASLGSHPVLSRFSDERGLLRTLPFVHRLEAFFAAVLVRGDGVR
jgi:16S rRNA (cytosine967-C5)-methyltransferase